MMTNVVSTHNGRIGTNACSGSDNGCFVGASSIDRASRIRDVGEDLVRAQENIILADHSCIDGHVILNLHVSAQLDTG